MNNDQTNPQTFKKNSIERIINWFNNLHNKKIHVEFITAILSVPVMLTVIILNLNNLNQNKKSTATTAPVVPIQIVIPESLQKNLPQINTPPTTIPTEPTLSIPPPGNITPLPTTINTPYPTYTPYPTFTPFPTITIATTSAN